MLVLTRKVNGHGLRLYDRDGRYIAHIQVCSVKGDRAQLGIDADPRFVVVRDELVEQAPPPSTVGGVSNGRTSQDAS